jgi:hypothetical protein
MSSTGTPVAITLRKGAVIVVLIVKWGEGKGKGISVYGDISRTKNTLPARFIRDFTPDSIVTGGLFITCEGYREPPVTQDRLYNLEVMQVLCKCYVIKRESSEPSYSRWPKERLVPEHYPHPHKPTLIILFNHTHTYLTYSLSFSSMYSLSLVL